VDIARRLNRLTAIQVRTIAEDVPDGGGLYLQVSAGGARSWIFRFTLDGRAVNGVGTSPHDPTGRGASGGPRMRVEGSTIPKPAVTPWLEEAEAMPLRRLCRRLYRRPQRSWRATQHAGTSGNTLTTAGPVLGSCRCIDRCRARDEDPEPIWRAKPRSASRLRGGSSSSRLGDTCGHRKGEILHVGEVIRQLLPAQQGPSGKHHPAPPYNEMADFVAGWKRKVWRLARSSSLILCRRPHRRGNRRSMG
jgi:hypothetical protein